MTSQIHVWGIKNPFFSNGTSGASFGQANILVVGRNLKEVSVRRIAADQNVQSERVFIQNIGWLEGQGVAVTERSYRQIIDTNSNDFGSKELQEKFAAEPKKALSELMRAAHKFRPLSDPEARQDFLDFLDGKEKNTRIVDQPTTSVVKGQAYPQENPLLEMEMRTIADTPHIVDLNRCVLKPMPIVSGDDVRVMRAGSMVLYILPERLQRSGVKFVIDEE
jgi:hypothetical protein